MFSLPGSCFEITLTCVISRKDVAVAREKHNNANNELNRLNNEIRSTEEEISNMDTGFGPSAEWKKLDGTCIDKVSGE
jgi:protein kinase C substrate 80K-H